MKDIRVQMERLVNRFAAELMDIYQSAVAGSLSQIGKKHVATKKDAPTAKAKPVETKKPTAKAKPISAANRSTPAERKALSNKIVAVLQRKPMISVQEIKKAVGGAPAKVDYAMGVLKSAGTVKQHGERRMALYTLAPKSNGAKDTATTESESAAPATTESESTQA